MYIDRIAVLQPIDSIHPKFSQNDPTDVGKWRQTFNVLQAALFSAIRGSTLPEEKINELTWSVTEGRLWLSKVCFLKTDLPNT